MKPDLEDLKITERELENLSGFEAGPIFIGGIFGGVYRSSVFRNPQRFLWFCLTEVLVFALIFTFTVPIGLSTLPGNVNNSIKDVSTTLQFLQTTVGIALLVLLLWNIYMGWRGKRFKGLMHLLDEIDRYHQVLAAIDLLDQLEAVDSQVNLANRQDALAALSLTRNSLVSALMTEKILRESRGLLARRHDLVTNIENNLSALQTIEINNRANEYGQLLNAALQIGMSVHAEIQQVSSRL
ncbi:MAG: gustatory receptor family protein [Scytolyngbya sp. HA4215-MV1]|jgi:hypothetical protein|nr:gustatory receptor family protein [Scytolyngbya sp. HA4215-MV1]